VRGDTITDQIVLVVEECYLCGIAFGMPSDYKEVRLRKRDTFYCPNGHGQHYTGKTDAEKLREANERLQATRDLLAAEERSHIATRGHLTRAKKKIKGGVCPAPGCKRHFTDLERHIASKHPGFSP
jgi:hypothetical protein